MRWPPRLAVRRRDLVVALASATGTQLLVFGPEDSSHALPTARILLALAGLALVTARSRPALTLVLVAVPAIGAAVAGAGPAAVVAPAVALFVHGQAELSGRRPSAALVGGTTVGALLGLALSGAPQGLPAPPVSAALCLLLCGACWSLGRAGRERQEHSLQAIARAVADAQAVERVRIAREMHDVVMNSTGLIAIRAGILGHMAQHDPEITRGALAEIEVLARNALREMRAMLGVLRSTDDTPGRVRPPGSLAAVAELVDNARAAGVSVEITGWPPEELPAVVATSTVRIVQEALANVIKHAAPTSCQVAIATVGDSVEVEVTDDGPTDRQAVPGVTPGGFGLVGMRERATAHAGSVTAAPQPGGGFRVHAVLRY